MNNRIEYFFIMKNKTSHNFFIFIFILQQVHRIRHLRRHSDK
jgi:hypothetical protein